MILHFLEVNCGFPPVVGNSTHVYNGTVLGSVVEYWCDDMYKFYDGSIYKINQCTKQGVWQEISSGCICECLYLMVAIVVNTFIFIIFIYCIVISIH